MNAIYGLMQKGFGLKINNNHYRGAVSDQLQLIHFNLYHMPHIKNLIDTDCYIEFDNATELRLFAERNEIHLSRMVFSDDKYIRFYSDGEQARPYFNNYDDEAPVHKYENVTEWVKPYRERDEDDYYQDYIDSNL